MIKRLPSVENGLVKIVKDGKMEVTFEMRRGMKWHDGKEITADDAIFQLTVMQDSDVPVSANYFELNVKKAEIIDSYTFKIYLDRPDATLCSARQSMLLLRLVPAAEASV